MLISVISVIVFDAGRMSVLLVTSHRWVMEWPEEKYYCWLSLAAADSGTGPPSHCSPAGVVCLWLLRQHFTILQVCS